MATGGRDDSRAVNGVLNIGTAVPNRIFVGGISSKTNEEDLRNLFSKYGNVKATKIIVDKAGTSKGYGFVTFETEEEAQKVLIEVDSLTLKDRKLNVAPAVKKHPYSRNLAYLFLETGSMHSAPVVWSSHPYSGSTGFPGREPVYYPQATWPLLWHQQLYLPQQCPYPQVPQAGYPQYVYSVAPSEYPYQAAGQIAGSDYSETSSADSGESVKNRSRASTPAPAAAEYDRNRPQSKTCHTQNICIQKYNSAESPNSYVHANAVPQLHHVLTKTVNGVAVMAYPAPFVMGSPTVVHVKDNGESDNVLSDLGYMHSPIASGALTPPPTPMAQLSCDFSANTSMESLRKS